MVVAGTEVARIGLGTNRLRTTPQDHDFLRQAVEAGVGLIDTAHLYTGGDSETAIGETLFPKPDGLVIATKGGYDSGEPDALREQIELSLERLRIETIDLYYLHRLDPETPLAETLRVIDSYREAGKIKEFGISAVEVQQIEAVRQQVPIGAVQNHYNVTDRSSDEVVDYCEENGIAFVPYYPLKGGRPQALLEIANSHDASPEQIALAWLLRRSPVILPIPGTRSIEHLLENLAALEIELTDGEFEALG
jgi:pyridoxine 4-dehydrogenase